MRVLTALPVFLLTTVTALIPGLTLADDTYRFDEQTLQAIHDLSDTALESDLAYEITRSLTTEIGPRLAGTAQEARAREWAVAKLTGLGFENVRVEPFDLDLWTRGTSVIEEAAITAPYPQHLHAISLGGAAATPDEGLEAEVVFFSSFDDLLAFDDSDDALAGKLVFINDRMVATRTGEGYGWANRKRQKAWFHAEDRGAAGVLIRSVGTSSNRFAHTGMMSRPEGRKAKIPALAVSAPDADQIERIHESGETLRVRLKTSAGWRGEATSGNVIAEITGAEAPEEIVIIGAHLDSWDNGTGALDDGAGVGIVTAAAKLIMDAGQRPRRTIRVVLFGAEEVGLIGARAYAQARKDDGTLANHVIGSESDFGAREIWRLNSNVGEHALPFFDAMHVQMQHLGITRGNNEGNGGPDMYPLQYMGMPVAGLDQNGEDYFEFHHTPNDTFDKIVPAEMAQNVAAWVMFTWLVADTDMTFRPGME
ncbi:M20/M25/M40 family metallo-hydrolase [Marinihelvus fidelis]|uniref:Carboxypeptidase Q n=1 Tax=Marinihelvus fidelis TaxID=2613842 RepID=A0A5N0TJK2_9GAMM|nr:M20/M25/M40 family metallo-hydrolase [Marinihelvus fidelis]KAA9134086.1 M20/M25/M40 family metallo-hydrolase [Marinihelvus fidelis]